MDFFAIATLGTYPTPTPTDAQRAAYFCSWGFLGTAPVAASATGKCKAVIIKLLRTVLG